MLSQFLQVAAILPTITRIDYPEGAKAGDTVTVVVHWSFLGDPYYAYDLIIMVRDRDAKTDIRGKVLNGIVANRTGSQYFTFPMPNKRLNFGCYIMRSQEGVYDPAGATGGK